MKMNYTNFLASMGVGSAHPGGLKITEHWLKKVNLNQTSKVLDVGCGTGQTIHFISNEYDCDITGIDSNTEMISKAKHRCNQQQAVKLLKASADTLPFNSQTFDLIISESVTSFTNISDSLKEYTRVLNKKGTLILLEMTREAKLCQQSLDEIKQFYGIMEVLSEEEWIEKLANSGFNSIQTEVVTSSTSAKNDFNMSEYVNEDYFDMMAEHYKMNQKYSDKLGARIYYCQ
ncbi:class I SAM-dependent methyltransferase [Aquibacillus rhizosphaerae]|uniref:Class I SAM-dependent methyltransferase n=1 Tax=Aquibacillus rhizosphaerae TaxID=3051431 RepID=A0ABT7L579_9BACI|nr:class I SAM-dependent methyltransferase [Aquibacillus sp. LR5S19]MDL4841023.1 class I SAM-dependent methyltransferase [Aquibacillus sp. LR5S19]